MKIFHIISSIDLSSGGPSKSVCELALQQARLGYKVTIITRITENPYYRHSSHDNLDIVLLKKNEFKRKLKYLIKQSKPDILHGHGLWLLEVHYMAALARKFKIPYIISPRGMLEPWALQQKKIKKKLAFLFYQGKDLKKANCIHATSLMEAKNIRNLGFNNNISVIPNGIDLTDYSVNEIKSEINKNKTLLFLSRIHIKKGIELLIEAWTRIDKEKRKSWQVCIAGNGEDDYINYIVQYIKYKELENEIKYIGPKFGVDKVKIYQQADLFVLPTYSENFGMVVAEALACSVPVITSTGTPWQDLQTYQCGWWVNNDVDTLARTIEEAISLPDDERKQMGKRGRKLIEEKYNIEKIAQQMIQLYEWILNKGEKTIL